jgi:hypothetical protein
MKYDIEILNKTRNLKGLAYYWKVVGTSEIVSYFSYDEFSCILHH